MPKVVQGLKENNLGHVMVVLGGVIPDEDHEMLKKQGVREIYGAGSDVNGFIELIKAEVKK